MKKNFTYVLSQLISLGGSAVLSFGSTLIFSPEERSRLGVFLVVSAIIGNASCMGANFEIFRLSALGNVREALKTCIKFAPRQIVIAVSLSVAFDAYLFFNNRLDVIEAIILAMVSISIGVSIQLSHLLLGAGMLAGVTALKGFAPAISILVIASAFFWLGDFEAVAPTMLIYLLACLAVNLILWSYCNRLAGAQANEEEPVQNMGKDLWAYLSQTLLQISGKLIILVGAAFAEPNWLGVASVALAISEISLNFMQISGAQSLGLFAKNLAKDAYFLSLKRSLAAGLLGMFLVVVTTFAAELLIGEDYVNIPIMVFGISIGVTANLLTVTAFNHAVASRDLVFASSILGATILITATLMSLTFTLKLHNFGIIIWAASQWIVAFSLHLRVLRIQFKKSGS